MPKFQEFWNNYPKKKERKWCKARFESLPDEDQQQILIAIPQQVKEWQLLGTQFQFIPYPKTWLYNERYWDEFQTEVEQPRVDWRRTDQGVVDMGRTLGIEARPGEIIPQLRARVEQAMKAKEVA